jgi:hypothetical protein
MRLYLKNLECIASDKKINIITNVDVDKIIDILISKKDYFYYEELLHEIIKDQICDVLKTLKDKETLWRSDENNKIYTFVESYFTYFFAVFKIIIRTVEENAISSAKIIMIINGDAEPVFELLYNIKLDLYH